MRKKSDLWCGEGEHAVSTKFSIRLSSYFVHEMCWTRTSKLSDFRFRLICYCSAYCDWVILIGLPHHFAGIDAEIRSADNHESTQGDIHGRLRGDSLDYVPHLLYSKSIVDITTCPYCQDLGARSATCAARGFSRGTVVTLRDG